MNSFFIPKKKMLELLVLPIALGLLYIFYPSREAAALLAFGFVWNWSASNDLDHVFQNRRYRMSMLKLVVNLQNLILKPFQKAPEFVKRFLKILPAGLFWMGVTFINESVMPWWAPFLGSLIFELMQFEISIFKKNKELP